VCRLILLGKAIFGQINHLVQPKGTDGKEEHLCGQLFLLGATVKEVEGGSLSLTTAADKEYILHSKDNDVKSWMSALEYAIKKADKFKVRLSPCRDKS